MIKLHIDQPNPNTTLEITKNTNNSADDSEFVPATEDDTDILDDNAMSDGAVFEGIIDKTLDEPVKNDTFTVKSYNPLNLLPNYLKIGTINIQGGYKTKLIDIINYFDTHNFNILGLTETQYCHKHENNKLVERHPHPTNKNLSIYIILDANGDNRGSGVGIMLTSTLYQHVHQIRFHKGRVLNIELGFKRDHKLNITCVYLPAGRDKQTNIIKKECNQFIDQLFRTQNTNDDNHKFYNLIMGDLNCYPKEKNNLNHHIIQMAKLKGFKDMAKFHAENQTPDITRTTHRIDYIFGNNNILNASIHTFAQKIPPSHFTSDHKAVITLLQNDLFKCSRHRQGNRRNEQKEKPNYSLMNDDLWENYKSHSKTYFKHRFQYIDLDNISTQDELDHTWNIFEHSKHDNQSTYCSIDDLPLPWRTIYDPANHHSNSDCWDTLQQQIDISDVLAILKNSPSNKAPGPSQITYEDLKHLHKDIRYPQKWRDALLFPIPKPHDWDSKLTNTRPITLLETTRKLMVSVFSQRLNQSLAKYNILQFNNRAGVLGQSCLEPLFQIQHSIEHARIYKKPLWIAIQDLSKAYDRVDITLLRLALQPSYKVLQGIDQGEVVSPLLWNIYYDPLFYHINQQSHLAYKCDTTKIKNIYHKDSDIIHNFELSLVGYLDDTTWFSPSLETLETKLDIAHSFY
ncbi:RNA-directed DNA polymerase from mobile element jockey-like [Rhizophagus irregularis DAOM 181602=DAOM 197198]|nr:RNA-directed DNA polymerase from mobile element jockey-like [Rhizophagus irregularis DAOM 181602=DAOM 197198]